MIIGIGIDIVSLERIEHLLTRFPKRTLTLLLHPEEREKAPCALPDKIRFVASRFAAKEAAAKALGTGFRDGLTLQDISVQSNKIGKPQLAFWGKAAEKAQELDLKNAHLSISHEKSQCVALVVLER